MKNYGVDLEREKLEQSPEDWVFGSSSPVCIYSVPEKDRKKYLPDGEFQFGKEDFMDCVTRGYMNLLETKFTYAYKNNLISEKNKKWLGENGYVVNDKILFSDRFIAILSGTTRQGNSLKAPAHAIHKNGLIPKTRLASNNSMTFEEYHDKSKITKELETLGKDFLLRFPINYEQVYLTDLWTLLQEDMANVAVYAWPKPVNGEYPRVDNPFSHAVCAFATPLTYIFDNYTDPVDGDWIKKLASDYKFYEYGYRIYVPKENDPDEYVSLLTKLRDLYQKLLDLLLPKEPPKEEKKDNITTFAKAIESFEGYYEGSVSWKNKNPGNIRGTDGKFLVFKTYEEGFVYLKDYLYRACTGKHKAYKPTYTIRQFVETYAPSSENSEASITNYTNHIAQKLGVYPSTQLKDLV